MSKPWFGRKTRSVESLSDEPSVHSDSSSDEVIDIKGDQFANKADELSTLNLTSIDMVALGLTTAIGGHYFAWNAGLSIGFGGFLIALFLISSAYYSLVLCIAELSSALPFAGAASMHFSNRTQYIHFYSLIYSNSRWCVRHRTRDPRHLPRLLGGCV